MAIDNIARGAVAKKVDAGGGTIDGDLHITGDLTVDGMARTKEQETLTVEDNMIVTNSKGIPISSLSGIALRSGPDDAYGVVYDPNTNSVNFGIGKVDSKNRFTFNSNEGHPLAIRADSNDLENDHYVKWDSVANMFVNGEDSKHVTYNDIFGICDGSFIKANQTLYINTDVPMAMVVDMLSSLTLTEYIEVNNQEILAGAILFEDPNPGTEGVYMVDLSTLGGSGYAIYLASFGGTEGASIEEILFLSEITNENINIIRTFIDDFDVPQEAGWIKNEVPIETNVGPIVVFKKQSLSFINKYKQYISCCFSLNRKLWDYISFFINYSVTYMLNTPL